MNEFLGFLGHMLIVASVLAGIFAAGYYARLGLAKIDLFWTEVDEAYCKIVVKYRKYRKTIGPGLQWIGLPGFYTLYKRKMTFLKCVTDEQGNTKAVPHDDKNINSFKTTRYPYALPFMDLEDSHGLHLRGVLAAFGIVEDYFLAFFKTSDWYAELNTGILSEWREFLPTISYDEDIVRQDPQQQAQAREAVSKRFWEYLNTPRPNGEPSTLQKLRSEVGINVENVSLPSIDPPPEWRAITLAPYKAQKEKEAAEQTADADYKRIYGPMEKAMEPGKKLSPKDAVKLRALDMGATVADLDVHSGDRSINPSTLALGGGAGVGIFADTGKNPRRGQQGNQGQGGGKNPPEKKPKKKKAPKKIENAEDLRRAQERAAKKDDDEDEDEE